MHSDLERAQHSQSEHDHINSLTVITENHNVQSKAVA